MPYDNALAKRIRQALGSQPFLTEKLMFGGMAFMVRGNVACGVIEDEMMVRVGPEEHDRAIIEPHVRPFDKSGRPSRGWVMVSPPGLASETQLADWVQRGVRFAMSLPAK